MIKLTIEPNDAGGYTASCGDYPDTTVDGPTYGLCEARAADVFGEMRHAELIGSAQLVADAARDDAIIKAAGDAVARKRGRPRKIAAPVIEGDDVPGVTVGPVADE